MARYRAGGVRVRIFVRVLGLLLVGLAVVAAGVWVLAPREPVALRADFDLRKFGEGVQVYFESIESRFDDITPGAEKRVVWAEGGYERQLPLSVVYIHGFTATSEEIRPVPDRIAAALGANLVFTRLTGHGRPGAAMAEATADGWMADVAEALAAGRAVGDRVVVIATSTGGTLAAMAARDPEMMEGVAALILVSPNFAVNAPGAGLLAWPGARAWAPWLIGREVSRPPRSAAATPYWTTTYPTEGLMPMAALVETAGELDYALATVPALFWFSDDDRVVKAAATRVVAEAWGGPVTVRTVTMADGDDANAHLVTGALASPGQIEAAVEGMLVWLRDQGIGG